jgi:hypothetical protein
MYKHLNISITHMTLRNDEWQFDARQKLLPRCQIWAKGHCSGAFAVPVGTEILN